MELRLTNGAVRAWRDTDAPALAHHGDNRRVWSQMRDAFPSPFTLERAHAFIAAARSLEPQTRFAITVGDEAVGGVGFSLHGDVERVSAELGYWVGEAHWGKGLASDAVRAVTARAVEQHALTRMWAVPYAHNTGSTRVLQKAGYVLEGRMRKSAVKEGRVVDQLLYAWVVPD